MKNGCGCPKHGDLLPWFFTRFSFLIFNFSLKKCEY